jgi:hypothetical protein
LDFALATEISAANTNKHRRFVNAAQVCRLACHVDSARALDRSGKDRRDAYTWFYSGVRIEAANVEILSKIFL